MTAYTTIQPGSQVRVTNIPEWHVRDLPPEDQIRITAQNGRIVRVLSLQPHGYLWLAFADGTEGFSLQSSDVRLVGGTTT
jgi:hypothetical protein